MNASANLVPFSAHRAASATTTGMRPMRGKRSNAVKLRQSTRRAERALKYAGKS